MKKSILVLVLVGMAFVMGCLTTGYQHVKYDSHGKITEAWRLDYDKAMTTSTITDVNLVLSDGTKLSIGKSAFIYDGNDWIKLGQGICASGLPSMFIPK